MIWAYYLLCVTCIYKERKQPKSQRNNNSFPVGLLWVSASCAQVPASLCIDLCPSDDDPTWLPKSTWQCCGKTPVLQNRWLMICNIDMIGLSSSWSCFGWDLSHVPWCLYLWWKQQQWARAMINQQGDPRVEDQQSAKSLDCWHSCHGRKLFRTWVRSPNRLMNCKPVSMIRDNQQ